MLLPIFVWSSSITQTGKYIILSVLCISLISIVPALPPPTIIALTLFLFLRENEYLTATYILLENLIRSAITPSIIENVKHTLIPIKLSIMSEYAIFAHKIKTIAPTAFNVSITPTDVKTIKYNLKSAKKR